jgi:hypothetical protein
MFNRASAGACTSRYRAWVPIEEARPSADVHVISVQHRWKPHILLIDIAQDVKDEGVCRSSTAFRGTRDRSWNLYSSGCFPAGRGVILRSHLDLNCRDFITLEAQTHTALPDSQ